MNHFAQRPQFQSSGPSVLDRIKAMMKARRSKNAPFWHHWHGGEGWSRCPDEGTINPLSDVSIPFLFENKYAEGTKLGANSKTKEHFARFLAHFQSLRLGGDCYASYEHPSGYSSDTFDICFQIFLFSSLFTFVGFAFLKFEKTQQSYSCSICVWGILT